MKLKFFDFEVFPHWWSCVFGILPDDWQEHKPDEGIKSTFTVVTSDDLNARDNLLKELQEERYVNTGYNIKGYDLMIANTIYQGFRPEQVKMVNDIIINPANQWVSKEHMRMAPFAKKRMSGLTYLDLYDSSDGTLKDKESTLGLNILESKVPFDKEDLTEEDKEDILAYCKHDVWAAMVWYMTIVHPFVGSKLAVAKIFNLEEKDAYCLTNAQLVAKAVDAKRTDFADSELRTIVLPAKIKDYVEANLPKGIIDYVCNNPESRDFALFENIVTFADGGIHSVYDTNEDKKETDVLYAESDNEYTLLNVDVSSYYPSIMIQLGTLSRSIQNPDRFKFVFEDRVRIKHKINKTKEDDDLQLAYKLILNTTYGASGSEYLALCDKYQRTRTCRYGQLLLSALANKIYNEIPDVSIIQLNTDGILLYTHRKYVDDVIKLKDEWCSMSGMGMDVDHVDKIWQRDVNNYLMVKEGGKIKRKGAWLIDNYIKPGYIKIAPLDVYGVGKAAIDWLVKGIDPMRSILKNTNITDFIINCKKGPSYRGVIQRMADGSEIQLYKCNRVIAVKDKSYGSLYKYKANNKTGGFSYESMPNAPEHCLCLNDDLSSYDFDELRSKIDYMYYIRRLSDKLGNHYKQIIGTKLVTTHQFDLDY